MNLLLLALLVALAVWSARLIRRQLGLRAHRRLLAARPGATADNPLVVRSAAVLEAAREALRCECGGEVRALGETPRLGLRVARGRCRECERDVDLYFVLPSFLH